MQPEPGALHPAEDGSTPLPTSLSVLVLDDDQADTLLLKLKLEALKPGVRVFSADSPSAAQELLQTQPIDCAIFDFHIGNITCEPLITTLQETHPFLPIIVLSGRGDDQKTANVLRIGAADYLPKRLASEPALQLAMNNAIVKVKLKESLEQEHEQLLHANKLLKQQSREIRSFYHTVSHELKTPITAIQEFNSLLSDEILGDTNTDQSAALANSLNCCNRLNRMVNDLFDAARIETGKLQLYKKSADLAAIIDHEVEIMRSAAEHKSISLNVMPHQPLPHIQADPARLGQVLCNLIGNAIKYTQDSGNIQILIEQHPEDNYLSVSVADDGYGISEEHAEFVFHRMYQHKEEGSSTPPSQSGMGIGLFLCHQIIKLHGGELSYARNPEAGSTFTFTLPLNAG